MTSNRTHDVHVLVTSHELQKVMLLSIAAGQPGNISAGIRYAIAQVPLDNVELYERRNEVIVVEEEQP